MNQLLLNQKVMFLGNQGSIITNKTIINVTTDSNSSSSTTTTTTTNDNEGSSSGKNELITIKDQFVPIESIFVSKITNSID